MLTDDTRPGPGRAPGKTGAEGVDYGLVVIGCSAGGIAALHQLLAALPADFALPILLVAHLSKSLPSRLPEVLAYKTPLCVKWAEHAERARGGVVYVAPRNHHLTIAADGTLSLDSTPPLQWWRPAVDRLFSSAAQAFGPRCIGVILSGAMWDGAVGMEAIAKAEGLTICQDRTADHFDMPAAAIDLGRAEVVLSPPKIAEALMVLTDVEARGNV